MTTHTAVITEVEGIRWRDWQARGAARDRRTTARMRVVLLLIVAALIVWSVVQLTSAVVASDKHVGMEPYATDDGAASNVTR